uniref:Cl3393_1 n=1 Tax=Arundo donax TaxID=35708 RepID=A0A0A9D489_ARUDO
MYIGQRAPKVELRYEATVTFLASVGGPSPQFYHQQSLLLHRKNNSSAPFKPPRYAQLTLE